MNLILQHPYIFLCCVIWIICGIVSIFLKKEYLQIALGATILIGTGWLLGRPLFM